MNQFSWSMFIQGLCRLRTLFVKEVHEVLWLLQTVLPQLWGFLIQLQCLYCQHHRQPVCWSVLGLSESLGGDLLNLAFSGNGRHASYAVRYLEQGFQVTWVFGRATSMP